MRSCERILADHEKWLEAEDKTGLDDLRADLSRTDLRGHGHRLKGATAGPTSKGPNCGGPNSNTPNCVGPTSRGRN